MPIRPTGDLLLREAICALARKLDAAPHGERGELIGEFAGHYGWSIPQVYRSLRQVGWHSGRKRRADAGQSSQDPESLTRMTGAMRSCIRKNGKPTLHTPTARSILAANGAEFRVGNSRINTLLRRRQMDLASQTQASPWQELQSLHPNHVHLVDPSLCLIYYLPDGGQAVIREDEVYKNKPENIARIGKLKVWRYVLVDHYSGTLIVRYYQAKGETQANLYDFLLYCWMRREGRVFHGVPRLLYWDAGSANQAGAIGNALRALDVTALTHEPGNPRSKGAVEVGNNIVETHFECRLKLEPVETVQQLNAAAEAWSHAWNANCLPQYDSRLKRRGMRAPAARYGLWQTILREHLRILPDMNVCRYLLSASPQERQVRADLTVSFKHPGAEQTQYYDLAGLPNVYPRASVRVSPLIYGQLEVLVSVTDYLGAELSYPVAPIQYDAVSGFRLDAAIIGTEFKSRPDTPVEQAGKAADRLAYPGRTLAQIQSAQDRNVTPFAGALDAHSHLAAIVPPAAFLRRPGTELHVPDKSRPESRPLTVTEACKRLLAELGKRADLNYYELVRRDFPTGITEPQLDALIEALRGPRREPVSIHS